VTLEQGIIEFLSGVAPVTAIAGANLFGLRRGREPPNVAQIPAVLVQRTTTLRGDDAWALAKALRKALVDFTGNFGEVAIDTVHLTNEFPMTDPEPGIIRIVQLYNIWYQED
jgi:hypothetical protein